MAGKIIKYAVSSGMIVTTCQAHTDNMSALILQHDDPYEPSLTFADGTLALPTTHF